MQHSRYMKFAFVLFCFHPFWGITQTPGKVGSLLTADRRYAKIAKAEGPYKAFLEAADERTVFFKPGPVNALEYLENRPNIPDVMNWNPVFAVVSKSMEWGVTSGPFTFQRVGARQRYGEYLAVWERDKKGIWKITFRAEVEHKEPKNSVATVLEEPEDEAYVRLRSKARLSQRNDIILSTDRLMGTILKADNATAYKEFLADDARLLFPWQEPVTGKKQIQDVLKKLKLDIKTTPLQVGRPYSGEYAYSYGDAQILIDNKVQPYYYIRIWRVQPDFTWKVIIEMFVDR